jgi:hypothetical protein
MNEEFLFPVVLFPCFCCGNEMEAVDVLKMYAELGCRFSDRKKALEVDDVDRRIQTFSSCL